MAITGVVGVRRGTHHTVTAVREEGVAPHPDLIQRAWHAPTRPDQWRVADFTYVPALAGFCYVSFSTDVYSRMILGWRVSVSKQIQLVASALEQALFSRRRTDASFTSTGLVHHFEAGSQYTSIAFTEALAEAGLAGSIGTVGDALDNALQESAIGLYKTELIDLNHRSWSGRAQLENETAAWVHWYNTTRLHSAMDYLPPTEYEQRYRAQHPATAIPAAA